MKTIALLFVSVIFAALSPAQSQTRLDLMPMPAQVQSQTGQLVIGQSFSIAIPGNNSPTIENYARRFVADLARMTGMPMDFHLASPSVATLVLAADHEQKSMVELGEDESYQLTVTAAAAKISAPSSLGILRGLQTFLQLIQVSADGFVAPALSIQDRPRFPWRGVLIDVSRHFIPLDVLKRNLDGMAAVKLNVLHWHLSDHEGFRVESKRFPRLHQLGSDGMFYTQVEIRDFVQYAQARGIRVIPEFDIPGHSRSWFVGYPELASSPGPYKLDRSAGDQDPVMDPTQENTYKFLDKFIAEMAKLFPDPYFHIGGDEVNGEAWDHNPKIQAFMEKRSLKSNQELQAYFNQRLEKIVSKHGKIMVGWDEILQPDLPKNIVVQSWRGQDSLATAARQGHPGLLSFGYYLDLMWPAAQHYAIDPMAGGAASLSPEEKQRILGGEACMWSEFVNYENIDVRIWPRVAAVAERLWSPTEVRDPDSLYQRLEVLSWRMESLGLTNNTNHTYMLRRMAGTDDIAALQIFSEAVEPVKNYTRMDTATVPVNIKTPLNRLVDGIPPESDVTRKFSGEVDRWIASGFKDAGSETRIRTSLLAWRDNDGQLQPLLQRSALLRELIPISQDLASLAATGMEALDYLDRHETAPVAWATDRNGLLERVGKPRADLLLVVAEPIQKLVSAANRH